MTVSVHLDDPRSADATELLEALSAALEAITGDSGTSSFDVADVSQPGACFAVARDAAGRALGCGALRPLAPAVAELKRMYARPGTAKVGAAILAFLEARAEALGYEAVRLETRRVNTRAVGFYERHGYRVIPNFGKYAGNAKAVCFEKRLVARVVA